MTAPDYEIPKDVVPPGNQTGTYYIPISNLPFNVSWQQMKDYVRQVCDVDHVEIFQKSTSGWIRVKGRENFDKAYEHLNGKEFNGRAIIADGRNGSSPILVRDLKVCKPIGSSNRPSSGGGSSAAMSVAPEAPLNATAGPGSYLDSSMFSSPTSTNSSGFRQARAPDGYSMSMPSSSFMSSPDAAFSVGHIAGYDPFSTTFSNPTSYGFGTIRQSFVSTYQPSSEGSQAMYNTSTAYAVRPPAYNDYYPPNTSALTSQMSSMTIGSHNQRGGAGGAGGIIYTEQRGVHIRDISRRASEDQIRKMIRDVAGSEVNLIDMIKIPMQEGNPRGHAFVHFRSASLAKRMAGQLNGYEFKGRKLQARLMKEGEAISSGFVASTSVPSPSSKQQQQQQQQRENSSGSSSSKHHRHRKEDGRRSERKERDSRAPKGASKMVSSTPVSSNSSRAVPLVVGGNLASASLSASSQGKHGKKSPVVIADGSSGRRPSDAALQ